MPKITRTSLHDRGADTQCDFCGYPMDLDEENRACYEIEGQEHMAFCSRTCAREYLDSYDAELDGICERHGYCVEMEA